MNYVVVKLINWRYSAGNTPDMKIDNDKTSEPLNLDEAIGEMNRRNDTIKKNQPYAWAILPAHTYNHLIKAGMYNSVVTRNNS